MVKGMEASHTYHSIIEKKNKMRPCIDESLPLTDLHNNLLCQIERTVT